jgi:hypothetical protein
MEELFNYFTTDNSSGKKCTERWLSKNNLELYTKIINWCDNINILKDIEFNKKVYHYTNLLKEIPTCLNCGSNVKFKRFRDGYQPYCTSKCQYSCDIAKNNWLESWKTGNSNNEHIIKRESTAIERYGNLDNYKSHLRSKIKESCMDKHGVQFVMQTESYKKKRKETLKEKYGSESYNNPNKTKHTRINNKTQFDDSVIDDFLSYKRVVVNRTMTIYRNNTLIINPNNLKRGIKYYHVDHKFSIKEGFLNNIPIEIITHPSNLEMIYYMDNLKKQYDCSISQEKLLEDIINFDKEIKFTHKELREKYENIKELSIELLNEKLG